MKGSTLETAVGFFVILGMLCVGYLTVRLGKMEWFGRDHYPILARFQNVTGLKVGANVEMAGVEIGKVEFITLDRDLKLALVGMRIRIGVDVDEEVIASVKTAGMIGDKFIMLTPGGSDRVLGPGEMITETESALDLEDLIGKYMFGDT